MKAERRAPPTPSGPTRSWAPAAKRIVIIVALGGAFAALGWRVARGAPHPLEAVDQFARHLRADELPEARALLSAALREDLADEASFAQEVARFSLLSRVEGARVSRRASERVRTPNSPYETCARMIVPSGFEEVPIRLVDEAGWRIDAMRIGGRAFGPTDVSRGLCRRSRLR